MEILSRQQAIAKGLKYYYTGEPCKHGHLSKRVVRNYGCYQCQLIASNRWLREQPKEYHAAVNKRWADKNREYTRVRAREWRANNPEKAKAQEQCPVRKEKKRQRTKENLPYYAAAAAKRRAAKRKATPKWADERVIARVYELAAFLTKETGEKYEVDHIIPLQGEGVCGLHVPANLQILTKAENIRKFNHWRG